MEGQQINYDFLNLSNNYSIKNNVTRDEEIQFSDEVEKINKNGWKQTRNMILTENAMYNLKKTILKRRIDYKTIIGITVSKNSDEFVIHCQDIDYDYHFVSPRKVLIIEIIAKNYVLIKEEELKLFEMEDKSLSNYVTTKKEKEKQQKVTRMPKTGQILVKDYLYKNQKKINNIKSDKKIRKGNIKIVEVQPYDFDIIKTIGRGSVGKIYLVMYQKDGNFYAMKSMRKDQLVSEGITNNIIIEKNILMDGQCEFILTMNFFYQTPERIYFICPFIKGGDLYHKLKTDIFFNEDLVRFYAAQIAIALQHLHDLGVIYRDLKPENILIDEDGYIKLCDFGSCTYISDKKKEMNFAGSPEYVAPEVLAYEGHNFMCDWWSFGILLYELLYGKTPFFNLDKDRMYDLIKSGSICFPKYLEIKGEEKPRNYKVSEDAKNIIARLLEKDPDNRLGKNGLSEIKKYPFFSSINFDNLKKKKIKAPFKPEISKKHLTANIDEEYLNLEKSESPIGEWVKDKEYENFFNGFNEENDDMNDIPEEDNNDKDEDD